MMFTRALSRGARSRFEKQPYPTGTVNLLSDKRALRLLSAYSWASFFLDASFMMIQYLSTLGMLSEPWGTWLFSRCEAIKYPPSSDVNCVHEISRIRTLFVYMVARGALLGIAQLHIAVASHSVPRSLSAAKSKLSLQTLGDLAVLLIPVIFTCVQGFVAMFFLYQYVLDSTMGLDIYPLTTLIPQEFGACLNSYDGSESCQNMDSSDFNNCMLQFGNVWTLPELSPFYWWPNPDYDGERESISFLFDATAPVPVRFQWLYDTARDHPHSWNSTALAYCLDIPSELLRDSLRDRFPLSGF